jgi:hypothetical protein
MSILLLVTMTVALQPCGICAFNVPAVHNRMGSGARSFASTTLQSDRILGAMTRGRDARGRRRFGRTAAAPPLAAASRNQEDEEDDEEDLVRVPRRRRGGAASERRFNQDDRGFDDAPSSSRRQGRSSSLYDEEEDDGYDSDLEDDEDFDDDEDDDDDEDWALDLRDIDTAALLENVVIPNPLLDSIDPDGAADRFPELARDPKFWLDMALFIAFLNFLSWAGPRDPYPDLPWF